MRQQIQPTENVIHERAALGGKPASRVKSLNGQFFQNVFTAGTQIAIHLSL